MHRNTDTRSTIFLENASLQQHPPDDADGTVEIALTVTYSDGTSEPTTARVTATPAPPQDVEPGQDDTEPENPTTETPKPSDPGTPSRPKAGGSSFGSS